MELARFGGVRFGVADGTAMLFDKFQISAGSDTEEQEDNGQGYVTRKKGKPMEISMTAILRRDFGIDVQEKALELLALAREGKTDYFYLGGEKLWDYKMMLKSADSEEISIAPGGKWEQCQIKLEFVQGESGVTPTQSAQWVSSSGGGGSTGDSGSSGGSGGKVVKPPVKKSTTPPKQAHGDNYMVALTGSIAKEAKKLPPMTGGSGRNTSMVTFRR